MGRPLTSAAAAVAVILTLSACGGYGDGQTAVEESPTAVPGMEGRTEDPLGAGGTSVGEEPTE